jgi:hypothetical protein
MSKALAAALAKLLESENGIPASAFTTTQRRALDDLARTTQALRLRTEGRGSLYEAVRRELLSAHLQTLRPIAQADPSLPKRTANIGKMRNSKGGRHGHALHYLLMKAISSGVAWQNGREPRFDLTLATELAGAGVLALAEHDDWASDQPLWLVENQALFDRLDWLPAEAAGTVVYYAGQLPAALLNWLAAKPRTTEVVLFPDYDGVGLLNYARLRKRCACPCSFWLMPNWQTRLCRFGNKDIWLNTLSEFQSAVAELEFLGFDDELAELVMALSKEGLALEQESVWL